MPFFDQIFQPCGAVSKTFKKLLKAVFAEVLNVTQCNTRQNGLKCHMHPLSVFQMELEKKKAKKLSEQKKSVDTRLEQEMKRNTDLQKEMYR